MCGLSTATEPTNPVSPGEVEGPCVTVPVSVVVDPDCVSTLVARQVHPAGVCEPPSVDVTLSTVSTSRLTVTVERVRVSVSGSGRVPLGVVEHERGGQVPGRRRVSGHRRD